MDSPEEQPTLGTQDKKEKKNKKEKKSTTQNPKMMSNTDLAKNPW